MKAIRLTRLIYPLLLLFALPTESCRDENVSDFALNKQQKYLSIGDSLQLGYLKVEPADEEYRVTWSSSNAAVATVDSEGLVIAKTEGEAVIHSSSGKETASCTIRVVKYGFRNATLFATTTAGHYHLILATAGTPITPRTTPEALLVLDLRLPGTTPHIAEGHYPLLAADDTRSPGFLPGVRQDGAVTGSYLVDKADSDTLLITGGELFISVPGKHIILGQLKSNRSTPLSFLYEGVIPQKPADPF